MSTGTEVTIAGRVFRLGAVYAPRPRTGRSGRQAPRRLLHHTLDSLLPGGRVTVVTVPSGSERLMTGENWAAWAGEPVGDAGP